MNQHGDNRGDEAAMRAMVDSFRTQFPDARFTILHQFRDSSLRPRLDAEVEWHSIIMNPLTGMGLLTAALLHSIGLWQQAKGNGKLSQLRRAYETADLVVSAPGGPYFGDIYANHEIVHWFFVWLAARYRKPVILYATSAGPFRNRLLNVVRRWLFPTFDRIILREEKSAAMLREFIPGLDVSVTADTALQKTPPPRAKVAVADRDFTIGLSIRKHNFPDARSAAEKREHHQRYVHVLDNAVRHLAERGARKLVMYPQLYGRFHADAPFLEEFGARIDDVIPWEIFPADRDSDEQRSDIADRDLFIASRYHPQIFAAQAGVPGICIAYEHKMSGFMEQVGMQDFCFRIADLDSLEICKALDRLVDDPEQFSKQIYDCSLRLRKAAIRTAEIASSLLTTNYPPPLPGSSATVPL